MVRRLWLVEAEGGNPYRNLALEEYLLFCVPKDTAVLYLWQNENTVVIGQNQNPYAQCSMQEVKKHGIQIARRLSGGGTVYHDKGNLNFTFIGRRDCFSIENNKEILLKALQNCGIQAVLSGRNDLTVQGRKVSGNAFYERGEYCYHHGTLLVDSNLSIMAELLKVDKNKWKDRGIDSVRSRVENLRLWKPELTVTELKCRLEQSFCDFYRQAEAEKKCFPLEEGTAGGEELGALYGKYCSSEWIFGKKISCNYSVSRRFTWGEAEISLEIEGENIRDIRICSDALETDIFAELENALRGTHFDRKSIASCMEHTGEAGKQITEDVKLLLTEEM